MSSLTSKSKRVLIAGTALAAALSLAVCAPFLVLCQAPGGHLATELTLGGCSLSSFACCGEGGNESTVSRDGGAHDAGMGSGARPPECTDSAITQASLEDSPRFDTCLGASTWGIEPNLLGGHNEPPSFLAGAPYFPPPGLRHIRTTILLI